METNIGHGPHNCTILKARVLYADIDKMGIVYHSNYFRWFEAARGLYMRKRGRPYPITEKAGIQLPLVECGIRYVKPAMYDNLIEVKVWVSKISAVQIRFEYEMYHEEELLVRGFTQHASINGTARPTRFPTDLADVFNSAEVDQVAADF